MRGRLEGRVALITGGGGEIGSAIARRFAAEGAAVAVADLEPAKAEATARSVVEAGGRATGFAVDVANESSADEAVKRAIAAFGRLTTLVNVAAAITPDGTVETLSLAEWNHALSVNLTGAFLMCKYAVPELRRAGGGSIINIASQLGHLGDPAAFSLLHHQGGAHPFHSDPGDGPCWRQHSRQHDLARLHPDRTVQCTLRRQGKGEASDGPDTSDESSGRARRNRGRRGLSRIGRRLVRHRDRPPDRRRLYCFQGSHRPGGSTCSLRKNNWTAARVSCPNPACRPRERM